MKDRNFAAIIFLLENINKNIINIKIKKENKIFFAFKIKKFTLNIVLPLITYIFDFRIIYNKNIKLDKK